MKEKGRLSKKTVILIGVFVVVFLILVFLILNVDTRTEQEKAYDKVESMAKEFYTGYYYKENSDPKDENAIKTFLSKYADMGITITLENLEKFYYSTDSKSKNASFDELKDCDVAKTKAIVYPVSPYGREDYKINVKLDCKFKK